MIALLLGPFILFTAFLLGRAIFSRLVFEADPDEEIVYGASLGLGLFGFGVLVLGVCRALTVPALWVMVLFPLFFLLRDLKVVKGLFTSAAALLRPPLNLGSAAVFLFSLVTLAASAAGMLAPETANDSLCYHVHLPKIWLEKRHIGFIPDEVNSLFPLLMEMLYTLGLGLSGMGLAKFFHFATGLLAAGAVLTFVKRHVRTEYAWYGALLFLTTPGIVNLLGTTYVDVAMACFTALTFFCVLRWMESEDRGWLLLSGTFLGFLLSIKYLGLITAGGLFLIIAWQLFKKVTSFSQGVREVLPWGAAIFLFAAYWYERSYLQLGNPVYPYFYSVFKAGDPTIHYDDIGVAKNALNLLLIPWTLTMHPEKFEGFGVQIGPAYLAFLPAIFLAWPLVAFAGTAVFFIGFFTICWFFLGQDLRFLYPILPLLAAFSFIALDHLLEKSKTERFYKLLLAAVFALHAALALYHYRDDWKVAAGLESEQSYLARKERSSGIAAFVNRLPGPAKILNAEEIHQYYFDKEMVRESTYADRTRYYEKAGSAVEVLDRLKGEGFTHILISKGAYRLDLSGLHPLRAARFIAENRGGVGDRLEPLVKEEFKKDETVVIYELYRIR